MMQNRHVLLTILFAACITQGCLKQSQIEKHLQRCDTFMVHSMYTEASIEYQLALEKMKIKYPEEYNKNRYIPIIIKLQGKDYQGALASIEQKLKQNPDDILLKLLKINILLLTKKPKQTLGVVESLKSKIPAFSYYTIKGTCHEMLGNLKKAYKNYIQALKAYKETSLNLSDIRYVELLYKNLDKSLQFAILRVCYCMQNTELFDQHRQKFKTANSTASQIVNFFQKSLNGTITVQEIKQAVQILLEQNLERAASVLLTRHRAQLSPADWSVLQGISLLSLSPKKALNYLKQFNTPQHLYWRGLAYMKLKNWKKAAECFKKTNYKNSKQLLKQAETYSKALNGTEESLTKAAAQALISADPSLALEFLNKIKKPKQSSTRLLKALILIAKENYTDAQKELKQIKASPQNILTKLALLAVCQKNLKEYKELKKTIKKIKTSWKNLQKIQKLSPELSYQIAWLLWTVNCQKEAKQLWKKLSKQKENQQIALKSKICLEA